MSKRIICLLLCFVMLFSVMLTGCSDQREDNGQNAVDDTTKEASKSTMTLTMYVPTKKPVSNETKKQVQDAFNKITKARFKTQVILNFCTYDEYYATVEEVIAANERKLLLADEAESALKKAVKLARADGLTVDDEWYDKFYEENPQYAEFRETAAATGDETTAEETVMVTIEGAEGFTISEIKYPDLIKNQIDIFWIGGYDKYTEYTDKEWLERLDDELSNASKKLKQYINNDVLAWAKWANGGTYAIPNNIVLGEYTYLLLNKKLCDKYNYNPTNITSIDKCANFLADIAKYETGVVPFVGDENGDIPITQTMYWNLDTETRAIDKTTFSILGNTYPITRTYDTTINTNTPFAPRNLFNTTDYIKQLRAIRQYKDLSYVFDAAAADKEYAVRVVKGNADLAEVYGDDYYMNVIEYPRIDEEQVFGNMLGVSVFSRNLQRSMEIITYLNTNSELRNILQYGIEGVNYTVNTTEKGKTITRLNEDYMLDLEATGNVFVAYPEEGMAADAWTYGKNQNKDAKSFFTISFRVGEELLPPTEPVDPSVPADEEAEYLNLDQLEEIRKLSAEFEERLKNAKNSEELEQIIADGIALSDNPSVKNQLSSAETATDSLHAIYYNWVKARGLYKEID